jgi:CubicO group peptidase (beta-lactamase class C family)
MTLNTRFRLASVSKPIVTTAAMVLVQQGKLHLDDVVTRYLPEFTPSLPDGGQATITLRQLMSHSAGLGYRFLEEDANGPYARAGVSDGMDASGVTLKENVRRIATVPCYMRREPPGAIRWRSMCSARSLSRYRATAGCCGKNAGHRTAGNAQHRLRGLTGPGGHRLCE